MFCSVVNSSSLLFCSNSLEIEDKDSPLILFSMLKFLSASNLCSISGLHNSRIDLPWISCEKIGKIKIETEIIDKKIYI